MTTKAEQETVIRWDREDQCVQLYTADPAQARRWTRLGYDVQVQGLNKNGAPHGWTAVGPEGCVRFRRVRDGQIVKRANGGQNLPIHRQVLPRRSRGEGQPPNGPLAAQNSETSPH